MYIECSHIYSKQNILRAQEKKKNRLVYGTRLRTNTAHIKKTYTRICTTDIALPFVNNLFGFIVCTRRGFILFLTYKAV